MKNKAVSEKRNINFFQALRRYEQAEKQPEKRSLLFPLLLLCTVAVLGSSVYLMGETSRRLEAEAAVLESYVESDINIQAMRAQTQLRQDVGFLAAYNEACAKHIDYLQNAERLESANFAMVESRLPADTAVLEYSFAQGALTVFCDTSDRSAPSRFAEDLTELGVFRQVTYEGFERDTSEEGRIAFSITCQLW